jgi:hypothetical protein
MNPPEKMKRKFEGKTYTRYGSFAYKADAERLKKDYKKSGFLIRIVPEGNNWVLYYRAQPKTKRLKSIQREINRLRKYKADMERTQKRLRTKKVLTPEEKSAYAMMSRRIREISDSILDLEQRKRTIAKGRLM